MTGIVQCPSPINILFLYSLAECVLFFDKFPMGHNTEQSSVNNFMMEEELLIKPSKNG